MQINDKVLRAVRNIQQKMGHKVLPQKVVTSIIHNFYKNDMKIMRADKEYIEANFNVEINKFKSKDKQQLETDLKILIEYFNALEVMQSLRNIKE